MSSNTSTDTNGPVYWDPYQQDLYKDPYPAYRRMREEAPLYYNEEYDFYAVSRFSDVERVLSDPETFSSARSDIMEFIKAEVDAPPGMFIWEDPPSHTMHRKILARAFTPRRMNEMEEKIRAYCVRCLDKKVGADHIDFIADLGAQLPGGVIGMLLGIPEEDRDEVRDKVDKLLRTELGKPMEPSQIEDMGAYYAKYIEWRTEHPSDDIMTELLNVEFKDETGKERKLSQDELLIFIHLLAGAGNETTARLIGWIAKLLSEHPDQRHQIVEDPKLVPAAIEEILRFEPPGPSVARYVTKDVEFYGQIVPAGSVMLALVASANRDERRFTDGDSFNIHRDDPPHITFGRGIHSCIGSALARIEGRIALEEIIKRFPDWTVDLENASLTPSTTTRGWDTMPAFIH